ncbi:MAG: LLM class flavin-dependent oxidoreductase [Gammaproteobacteria bacterium]|nr:LLM class flavin-dependent oxidoreductase [Gammaproteobacteria bacterium]
MGIEFGMSLTGIDNVVANARRLETLGYDFIGCGEHVSFHGPTSNSFISLGVAAGATERIKLLSAIVLLPLYPATLAAKLAATLDVASGGRYHMGVGVGGEMPREFEACGVPLGERGARTNEALQIIRRLWTEENVTFEGRFNTLHEVSIAPKPVQQPGLPIWVSGRKEAAMKRAARYGDGWMPYMYTPDQLRDSLDKIRGWTLEAGRPVDAVKPSIFAFSCCHAERGRAIDMAVARLSVQYAQDFSKIADKYVIAGTPADCRARIQQYVEAGAGTVFLSSACTAEYQATNEEIFAKEVLAAFK